jgi:uncharacterized protein (TIRG00374 family)
MTYTKAPKDSRRHRWRTALFAAAVLAALVAVVLHFGDLRRFVDMARKAQPAWMIAAVGLQATTYLFLALGWSAVLDKAGAPLPLWRLFRIAILKLFIDQVVPAAGMSGNVLLVERLRARGTPKGAAMSTLLVSVIGFYAAYAVLALAMMVALWLQHEAKVIIVGPVTAFLVVAVAVPALWLWLWRRGEGAMPRWMEGIKPLARLMEIVGQAPKELVYDRWLVARVAFWNGLIFIADAATLAVCLRALGGPFLPLPGFIALMAASIAVTLAPLPMGLGSFEATCTATLAMLGVPAAAALAATLLLRMLTLWLPLLPGLWLMRRAGGGGGGADEGPLGDGREGGTSRRRQQR